MVLIVNLDRLLSYAPFNLVNKGTDNDGHQTHEEIPAKL